MWEIVVYISPSFRLLMESLTSAPPEFAFEGPSIPRVRILDGLRTILGSSASSCHGDIVTHHRPTTYDL